MYQYEEDALVRRAAQEFKSSTDKSNLAKIKITDRIARGTGIKGDDLKKITTKLRHTLGVHGANAALSRRIHAKQSHARDEKVGQ